MVVVKKKKGESDEKLIARFRKATADIIKEARDRKHHKTDAEKRKEKRSRLKHWDELKRQRSD